MDNESASNSHDEQNVQLSLLDLPVKIFQHICSFLDASTLVHSLSLVCKQFYMNLKNDLLWKERINRIWPDASHSILRSGRFDKQFWMFSCVAIEKQTALWQQQDSMQKVTIEKPCNGSVASVLLRHINGITYTVSATHHTLLCHKLSFCEEPPSYEIRKYDNENFPSLPTDCLTAIDHTIYGCTSDSTVKSWVLMNTGLVHQGTYEIERSNTMALLRCMASCPERALFATGSFRGTVYVFDSRSSNKPIRQFCPYTGNMMKLAMDTEYILSASRHNTVSVWDQRAGRIMKSIRIPGRAFPTCMSMQPDWVCVGNSEAKLHLLNPKKNFKLAKSYSTEHTREITGVRLTHGCLITSSMDGTVKISSPTNPPKPIATLLSGIGSIASMDYLNDTLAISGGNNITVWRPK